ncbi:uncharacterized protein LOC116614205 isoform X2 [Nematostella vectensis]|uniref:uncharacterized protein LOC116614205 isoform X2 n=1 Tax=Nematostella vectensis TaxID=45351 RepID=UPI002076EDAA|nr:uncharacterized protein LOC116614205 isoform X2 [Nematostella vectensis]
MAHKPGYESLPGSQNPNMAAPAKVVLAEPQKLSSEEEYVLNLDPSTVATWSCDDVVMNFLNKAGLQYLSEQFVANKINGKCLMLLQEHHLVEMGIQCLGDRLKLMDLIQLLKKKKKEAELTTAQWSGVTPSAGCAYKEDCGECCVAYLCPCCLAKTFWRVTGQGIFYKKEPPCGLFTGSVSTEYMDYRFLKDLELKRTNKFCCCCTANELEIYSDDHDSGAVQKEGEAPNPGAFHPHVLRHPEAAEVEKIIRNAWSRARLVAE